MSTFGVPRGCNNGCGGMVYFDAHSSIGHPTPDKWVPLEFKEGMKTDTVHNCPNKKQQQNGTLPAVVTTTATTTPSKLLDSDGLAMIKVIAAALNDYIAIKENGT